MKLHHDFYLASAVLIVLAVLGILYDLPLLLVGVFAFIGGVLFWLGFTEHRKHREAERRLRGQPHA